MIIVSDIPISSIYCNEIMVNFQCSMNLHFECCHEGRINETHPLKSETPALKPCYDT